MKTIKNQLDDWDGKSADFLKRVYAEFAETGTFLDEVLRLSRESRFQNAATWLLKHHLDEGNSITATQRSTIIRELKSLQEWEAKLHVLQCLPRLSLTRREADQTVRFLRVCVDDANKFVRAWAYGGFHIVALQHPNFRDESEQRLAWAIENEAPSVRARLRQVLHQKPKSG
ncbi:MAG: hypothetical protein KDB00_02945 [Planctomycetales bacterium]|nr:hypothetical protein [Planctomycetales bacterium]